MADDEPRSGELTTANYGWVKPTVADSDDAWGGMLNADLDGIDTTVKGVSTVANAAYPATNPAGYITAAAIPAPYVLPTASTSILGGVKVDGSTIAINSGIISAAGASITVSDAAPPSPSAGALWFDSAGGQLYVFYVDPNTSQWVPTTNQMGGGYATQVYVNSLPVIGDNRLINGDMRIDQRNNGASGTAVGYTVDRWQYYSNQAGKFNWGRNTPGTSAFPYFLFFTSTGAYSVLAGDNFAVYQPVEADMITDFQWGTASAQPVTLSFFAYSNQGGTFSGAIRNGVASRSYPFTFSLPNGAWTKIAVTIPGDTGGTWMLSGNAAGALVGFDLGSGSTFRAAASAWTAGNYSGATGAVSVVGVNGAAFFVTGVKLEIGSVATPYNRQSLAKSMADCQRYYQTGQMIFSGYGTAGQGPFISAGLPVWMRALPTTVPTNTASTNLTGLNSGAYTGATIWFSGSVTATGTFIIGCTYTASAEL